jgi:hypothetical protein
MKCSILKEGSESNRGIGLRTQNVLNAVKKGKPIVSFIDANVREVALQDVSDIDNLSLIADTCGC